MIPGSRRGRRRRLWLAWLGLVAAAAPGRAHDPFEITVDGRLSAGGLELVVTMAPSTAMALVVPDGKPTRMNPDDFETLRPRFAWCAARLFELNSGGGPLPIRSVTVELAREFDVEFRLRYATPALDMLRVRARLLANLPEGYGAVTTLHGAGGELLGQTLLTREAPAMQVSLPAPKPK